MKVSFHFWFGAAVGISLLVGAMVLFALLSPPEKAREVEDWPSLVAGLKRLKTTCEDWSVLKKSESRRQSNANTSSGEALYSAMRAEVDYFISYLQAALAQTFHDKDAKSIPVKVDGVNNATAVFRAWAMPNDAQTASSGAATGSSQTTAAGSPKLADIELVVVKVNHEHHAKQVEAMHKELEGCRLRPWHELP